jgi:hypothetical protein
VAHVGASTRDNVCARPDVTLTWLRSDSDYQLIVDGRATVLDDPDAIGLSALSIDVVRGILHRLAGRPEVRPACLPLHRVFS